ncbi:MAG: ATPase [Lentisphaerae bacterium GWF2_45_14]|nr:MAG: ATPase [Lentisphaerae bacterium GWF2_45_14]
MKRIISQLIDDFHERELPELSLRNREFPELANKADVIIGMRRTGKTFFCFQRMKQLLSSGIPMNQILYLNFEDDRLLDFSVKDFQTVLDVYYSKYPENRDVKCHFFFDEIQSIEKWEVFIRRLLDTENVQISLTGSSSKLLSKEIATSLRGRSISTEIFPFSFKEFLRHHDLFETAPEHFSSKTASILRKAASDYIEIGGFPEVQNIDKNLRTEILQGYIDSVLLKDVVERHKVSNIVALKHLVNNVMTSPCSQFSVNKFYNTLKSMSIKCTKNNLYEYLDHLLDAYLFYRVPLHTRSEKTRMVNPPKIYVIDTGLLNAMTFRNSVNHGHLLENMVFMHLRYNGFEIEYVNTEKAYETDFFARHPITGEISLIQVCWDISNEKTFARELRGLKSAMTELGIAQGTIVTWDEEKELDDGINIIPAWKWLLN